MDFNIEDIPTISNIEASENILKAVEGENLAQNEWYQKYDNVAEGRWVACLLGSMSPGHIGSTQDCNGRLMPLWMAEVTINLFDGINEADIYPIARRYAKLVAIWDRLSEQQWGEVKYNFNLAIDNVGGDPDQGIANKIDSVRKDAIENYNRSYEQGYDDESLYFDQVVDNQVYASYLSMFNYLLDQIEIECNK